jgi:large repetitive protein
MSTLKKIHAPRVIGLLVLLALATPLSLAAHPIRAATILDDIPAPTVSISDAIIAEGDEASAASAIFTISLSAASGTITAVSYCTANDTALDPSDYAAACDATMVTFAPGQTSQSVSILIGGDRTDEPDETFFVNLTAALNLTIADGQGVGTIIDDDDPPGLSISDCSVIERNIGTVNCVFQVALTAASAKTVSVEYATADGTATAGSDYVTQSGTLVFLPGQAPKTISIVVDADLVDEQNQTFGVNLGNQVNAILSDAQGQATIIDDDAPPEVSVDDCTTIEGDAGAASCDAAVTLSAASEIPVVVSIATLDGAAVAPADYTAVATTDLVFLPGDTTQAFSVATNGDPLDEADEVFELMLTGPINATIVDGQATGTITNDDLSPTMTISNVSVGEGTTGTSSASFAVSLSAPSGRAVTVDYVTVDDTADAGSDYVNASGTLIFAPGVTVQYITVLVTGDLVAEPSETFVVSLTNPANAVIADGLGVGSILDGGTPPVTIAIDSTSIVEGESGLALAIFTVSLSRAAGQPVTVEYQLVSGSATAPSDYLTTASIEVNIPSGLLEQEFAVQIHGDRIDEENETFFVILSNPLNAVISVGQGVGTILDDDSAPTLRAGDCSLAEGDTGAPVCIFSSTLSAASQKTVTVSYSTADGSAIAPGDYAARVGTLTFPAGTTTLSTTVLVAGDTLDELDESFTFNLSGAIHATIADAQGVGRLSDDDMPPGISVSDCAASEGDSGTVPCTVHVTLSARSGKQIIVSYATADLSAAEVSDYIIGSGSLIFSAGETAKEITVAVKGDTLDETDEAFAINLSSPTNATISDGQGLGIITDDDAQPTIAIGDASVTEGDAGIVSAVFSVSLSAASGKTVIVSYTTADATAVAPGDYVAATTTTLSFPPGMVTQHVTIPVNGDGEQESDETLLVNLTSPLNTTIADGQGVGIILDDDGVGERPTISIDDVTVIEGDSGVVGATFSVSLSAVSSRNVTVAYATADGSATAGSDYNARSGTLSFAANGPTTQTIIIEVRGDRLAESNETFVVGLSAPVNATIADGQGVGMIVAEDYDVSLPLIVR